MLKIGTEITLTGKDGQEHRSCICLFVTSWKDNSVYAVTSAAFTKLADPDTSVSAPGHSSIGKVTDAPTLKESSGGEENHPSSSLLFGYIKIAEELLNDEKIDPVALDVAPATELRTTQRLYTDPEQKEPSFYVSEGNSDISLPCEAFSVCLDDDKQQIDLKGLSVVRTFESANTSFLSGTPLFTNPKTVAGMIVAGSHKKGFAVVLMDEVLRDGLETLPPIKLQTEMQSVVPADPEESPYPIGGITTPFEIDKAA